MDVFSLQAGFIDKAEEMATKALQQEEAMGSRPERMMEIHHLDGTINDEVATEKQNLSNH